MGEKNISRQLQTFIPEIKEHLVSIYVHFTLSLRLKEKQFGVIKNDFKNTNSDKMKK